MGNAIKFIADKDNCMDIFRDAMDVIKPKEAHE